MIKYEKHLSRIQEAWASVEDARRELELAREQRRQEVGARREALHQLLAQGCPDSEPAARGRLEIIGQHYRELTQRINLHEERVSQLREELKSAEGILVRSITDSHQLEFDL